MIDDLLSAPEAPSQETGVIALRGVLNAEPFVSFHDFSFGGHAIDYGWQPKTFADHRDWYGGALAIAKRLATSNSPYRDAARFAIAEHFRTLWCFGHVFDELEQVATAIGKQEHWPEGWLAVRKTIALDGDHMEVGLAARLLTLAEHLAPARFGERVRTCVLTPAHAVADLAHWETADDYSQAHQAVIDEARRLGRESGGDLDLLEGLWPEMFGPNAHQATWFGEGLAETVVDIPETWSFLLDRCKATDDGHRNSALLGGFLRYAAQKDKEGVEHFLDDAVNDPLLRPVFPSLQIAAGVNGAGVRRLIASIQAGAASPWTYWDLARGTVEAIPPVDLSRIVLRIAGLPDGCRVAVEMLSMRFHGQRDDQKRRDAPLSDCGRWLLRSYPFDQLNQTTEYELAIIANVCLCGNEAAEDAGLICRRVVDAQNQRLVPGLHLDRLVETIFSLHPQAALDCWLGAVQDEWRLQDILSTRLEARNPLSKVPTPVILDLLQRDMAAWEAHEVERDERFE